MWVKRLWLHSLALAIGTVLVAGGAAASCQSAPLSVAEEKVVQQALSAPRQSMLNVGLLNGIGYASQFGTGQNGIAAALQHAETVVVDPAYAGNEHYGSSNLPAPANDRPVHLIDYRFGMQSDQFSNWSAPWNTVSPAVSQNNAAAHSTSCNMNFLAGVAASEGVTCVGIGLSESAPGYSIGNPAVPPSSIPSGAPWSVGVASIPITMSYTSGIMGATGGQVTHTAPGDTINYFYAYSNNGATAASDEGVKALAADTFELPSAYLGTLTSASVKGATAIKTKSLGAGIQGQGQYLIDLDDRGKVSGRIVKVGPGLVAPVNAVTIDGDVAPSNAWGTLAANVAPPTVLTGSTFTTPEIFSVKVMSGAFNTTALLCIASQFHECAIPTSVTVSGGVATLTVPLRRPHAAGALVMQGGAAGMGIELTANTVQQDSRTLRYLQDVFGSTDGRTLQVGMFFSGSVTSFDAGSMDLAILDLGDVASSGSAVTASIASNGSFFHPQRYTGSSFTLAGASDPALNATCTGLSFDATGTFTCTIAGLKGVHRSPRATASLGNNGFNLWPMAETLDVQDYSTNPVSVDGTFVLEPNVINFSGNDTIEQTHNQAATYASITAVLGVEDPYTKMGGASFAFQGHGIQALAGGGNWLSYPALMNVMNLNRASLYQGSGGNLWPTNLLNMGGFDGAPYSDGIAAAPGPLRSFIEISPSLVQLEDPSYRLNLFDVYSSSGVFELVTFPKANSATMHQRGGTLSVTADGDLTLHGSTVTVQGPLAAGSIADTALAPGQCVQAGAGGVLKSTGGPCRSASGADGSGALRYVGTIATANGTHDALAVPGIKPSNHCSAQAIDAQAAGLAEYLSVGANGVTLNHAALVTGATFDIFCNVP
jgi:hypothetical protein